MIHEIISQEPGSIALVSLCLILSACFSAAETAITSMGVLKIKHLMEQKGRSYSVFKLWLVHPSRVIATILLFNNIVTILASAVTTQLTNKYTQSGAIGIATGISTFLVLIFGEIVPKSFAKAHVEKISLLSMRLIAGLYYLFYPVIRLLSGFADGAIYLLSKGSIKAPLITEEELEFIVNETQKAGVLRDIKKDIIESAFDFDETTVREIMTPRTRLTAISIDAKLEDALHLTVKTGHSRIPVYRQSIDHIVGLLLAKDLLNIVKTPEKLSQLQTKDLMREALFAPESKSIMEVFKDLKKTKSHLAIIIDEYGGTAGIVTMEDILEEIVGEIQDEFDAEEAKILKIGDNVFEVSGGINIEDFTDYFNIKNEKLPPEQNIELVDTLSGWITQMIGQMPTPGQKVQMGPLHLEVIEVSNRRINLVRVEQSTDTTAKED